MTIKENIYTLTTSTKLNKQLHHRMVPMMMFDPETGKEAVLPIVLGTSNDMVEAETYAENKVKEKIGHVDEVNRGPSSTWHKLMDHYRTAKIIELCTRMPNDFKVKFFDLGVDQVLDTYGAHEMGVLKDHYQVVHFSQPHLILLDQDVSGPLAFQGAVDKIKAMGEDADFFLDGFTTHSVKQLIKYLVSLLPSSENTTGLSGTPSNNGTETKTIPTT